MHESGETPAAGAASGVAARVARAVVAMSASQLAVIAAGFVTSIAQARLLGAVGRGDVTRFNNASALAVLYLGLGINSAITYFLASGATHPRALARLLGRLYAGTLALVAACAVLAVVSPLRRFLPHDLSALQVVLGIGAFFALSQLSSWVCAFQSARADFTPINTATVAVSVAGALASVALLWVHPEWAGPSAIIALLVALEALRASILLFYNALRRAAAKRAPALPSAAPAAVLRLRTLLRYSLLSYCSEALQFLTYRFDMWVVDAWRGAAELGRYSLAVSLAQMVWIVPTAAARVLFPYSAMLGRREAATLAWRTARIASLVSAAAAAAGLICAHLFLTTLFGTDFAEVPSLLGILLLGIVPYSVSKVLSIYLSGINAVGLNVLLSIGGLAVTVALDLSLIPLYGAHGAAWATAGSYTAYTALTLATFIHKSPLTLKETVALPFGRE